MGSTFAGICADDNYIKMPILPLSIMKFPGGSQLGLSSYPLFNPPQELGDDLIKLGFNVVNHATNHILDKVKKAYKIPSKLLEG